MACITSRERYSPSYKRLNWRVLANPFTVLNGLVWAFTETDSTKFRSSLLALLALLNSTQFSTTCVNIFIYLCMCVSTTQHLRTLCLTIRLPHIAPSSSIAHYFNFKDSCYQKWAHFLLEIWQIIWSVWFFS